MRKPHLFISALALTASVALVGCDREQKVDLAPQAKALEPAKPASAKAVTVEIQKASAKVGFAMDAPMEKIRGKANGSTTGSLHIDQSDITKSTGLLEVDISGLELFQTVADEDGKFGEERKSEMQNQHARAWLEIGEDAPAKDRQENSVIQFKVSKITGASATSLAQLSGAERKITLSATGDFLLHGRKSVKTAELELTFKYSGEKLDSVSVRTTKPFAVDLAEHEVRPREAFGKLAQKTLSMLAPKVAKAANVSIEFSAQAK